MEHALAEIICLLITALASISSINVVEKIVLHTNHHYREVVRRHEQESRVNF